MSYLQKYGIDPGEYVAGRQRQVEGSMHCGRVGEESVGSDKRSVREAGKYQTHVTRPIEIVVANLSFTLIGNLLM
jgi:hypothetical protein